MWRSIASVEHQRHLQIIAQQTTLETVKQNKTRLMIYPHMPDIVQYGWVDIDVPLNGQRVYKKHLLTNIDDVFNPDDILLYVHQISTTQLRVYNMACLRIMKRLQYNVPPLEVEIELTASHLRPPQPYNVFRPPEKMYDVRTFAFSATFFDPGDTVVCTHSEFLTWDTLYYILQTTKCTKLRLLGCYSTSAVGVQTKFSPFLHGHVFKVLTQLAEMCSFSHPPENTNVMTPASPMQYKLSETDHLPLSTNKHACAIYAAEQKHVNEALPLWELNTRETAACLLKRTLRDCLLDHSVPMTGIPQRMGSMPGIYPE